MKKFILITALLFLSGCYHSVTMHHTGRSLGKGKMDIGLGFSGQMVTQERVKTDSDDNVIFDEKANPEYETSSFTFPQVEVLGRYGITENFDLGLKFYSYFLGYELNAKYQFLGEKTGAGFSMSGLIEASTVAFEFWGFTPGVALSYDFSDIFGLYGAARYTYMTGSIEGDTTVTYTDKNGESVTEKGKLKIASPGHAVSGTLGLNINISGFWIRPEFTFTKFFIDSDNIFDNETQYMMTPSLGLGFNF